VINVEYEVSIVIPVYNGENKLRNSIESLLKQTYKKFEIVVINDGSKDATQDILNEYASKHTNINVYTQQNSGVSIARNKGIELAKGRYICFLDADDSYEERYVELMLNKIKSKKKKICYCGYKLVTPELTKNKKTRFVDKDLLKYYVLGKVSIHTSCWIIEKNFLVSNSIKFAEGVSWGEDFEFFCHVIAHTNEIVYVDDYLTNYRLGFDNDQLSAFSIDKIKKDVESINRLLSNDIFQANTIKNKLLNYRLPALITYRLLLAFDNNIDPLIIKQYYEQFRNYLKPVSLSNGMRSLKLIVCKLLLHFKLLKYNKV